MRAMIHHTVNEDPSASSTEALKQLDAILDSPAFASSKRCQEFLCFVVHETLEGRADSLKERTIALEVFGKGSHFEPSEDSLVRVKAREVRRRLAEYYAFAPEDVLRIDIPLGSYVPLIHAAAKPVPVAVAPAKPAAKSKEALGRRHLLWLLGGSIGAIGVAPVVWNFQSARAPLELFWRPIFATKRPLLIFIPILKNEGELTDRVGIGTTAAAARAADYLTTQHYPYYLRFGSDLTFSQLREQPSLLLGGFSSQWTHQMTGDLRFNLVKNEGDGRGNFSGYVSDTKTGRRWGPINAVNGYSDQDYAILCRLFDRTTGQIVLIAAGITTFGTESAATFLFDSSLFLQLAKEAPSNWETKNFQAVIHVSIIGATPSSPQLIATDFW
jgi:hypothetical protein